SLKLTLASSSTPTTATIANIASDAPPRTGWGIAVNIAPNFGKRPRRIMKHPAVATTHRLRTRVKRTKPTFSLKLVYGKELRIPPSATDYPSARIAREISSFFVSLPIISETAKIAPVVSTQVIITTTSMLIIAPKENCGTPNWNGTTSPNASASRTWSKFASPNIHATSVPMTSDSSTPIVAKKPRNTRWDITMNTSVPSA